MTKKKSNLVIGIFLTFGSLLLIGGIIWVGASQYFTKGGMYVAYFDESVQGLVADSTVKYRGVDVGRVKAIQVAPDNRHIEVTMKISLSEEMAANSVAQLKTAGLTGIVFVEIEQRSPQDKAPRLSFEPDYPVIPSRPSQLTEIMTNAQELIREIRRIDFKAISDQVQQTLKGAEDFISGPKMAKIMADAQSAVSNLDSVMARLNRSVSDGKVDEIIEEARKTVAGTREMIARIDGELKSVNLGLMAGRAEQTMQGLSLKANLIADEIRKATENLRRASESVDLLMDRLSSSPSLLLNSSQPPERGE